MVPALLRRFALALSLSLSTFLQAAGPAPKPNFVVIFIDDLGYGDIATFGSSKQKTPELDRMAAEGMKLTSFYAAPVCSASRAQIMTGCYAPRVSVPAVFFPAGNKGLNPSEITVAERLKELGYATACIGKWHLGDQPEFFPTRHGFDLYLGIPYSNDMQRVAKETGKEVIPLVRNDKVEQLVEEEAQSLLTARYTEEAVKFIQANREKPFFLYLPHTAIHLPLHPGNAFLGKSANGPYGDWVEEVDWSTGQILKTLRDLKLDERTLVIFTSDNGPWMHAKTKNYASAGPLRGSKGSTWEGGVRVPTIAWWPGKVKAGSVCDAVAANIDVLPTCVELAGGTLSPQPVIDGRSLAPILLGKSKESPREAHYYFNAYTLEAVRQGPWKLALVPQAEAMGKNKVPEDAKVAGPRLYNLESDIGERTDVAAANREVVQRLSALAATIRPELAGPKATARRPAGEVANPQTLYPAEPKAK